MRGRLAGLGVILLLAACGDAAEEEKPPEPRCGDGTVDEGEFCDDGEANSDTVADACRTDCTAARCGDGAVDEGEACDDGNDVDTDACRNGCSAARCGDNVVQAGVEECDDGVLNSDTEPDACRRDCKNPVCGDGIHDTSFGEACDDGNDRDTDACLTACTLPACGDGIVWEGREQCDEGAGNSDLLPDTCRTDCTDPVCGDAVKDSGEACDDGNDVETDACRIGCIAARCGDGVLHAGVEECDDGPGNDDVARNACRTSCKPASCGDGVIDSGEQCDDQNDVSTDLCLGTCVRNSCGDGFVWEGVEECDLGEGNSNEPGSECRTNCLAPFCHDGIQDAGEECDDGNERDDDGCVGTCVAASCGDGLLWKGQEACDDGENNADVADACRTSCELPFCGDGIQDGAEGCDDGVDNSDENADACRTSCVPAECGDGIVDSDEACDEGPRNDDEIPNACRTSCQSAGCGDRVIDEGEECDDGNLDDGDGCDAACLIEPLELPGAGESVSLFGSIDGTEDTFDRPEWDFGLGYCADYTWGGDFYFDRFEFENQTGSDQDVLVEAHWGGWGYLLVYVDGFDPEDSLANCQSGNHNFLWDLDVDPFDDFGDSGSRSRAVTVPAGSRMTVIATTGDSGAATGFYDLIVDNANLTVSDEEPNDDSGSAVPFRNPVDTSVGAADEADEDWYSFDATGGTRYRVEVLRENGNCFNDYNWFPVGLELYDTDGASWINGSESHPWYDFWNGTGCAGFMWTPDLDGTYYLRVYSWAGDTLDPYYLLVRER